MVEKLKGPDGRFIRTHNDKFHNGYKVIYMPEHPHSRENGYVYEHILVAEEKLGRSLLKEEVVHHINGNKLDNNPENLMVFKNNVEHMKHHWKSRRKKYVLNSGEEVNIKQLSERSGLSYTAVYQRLMKLGWTADEILYGRNRIAGGDSNAAT